MKPRRLSPENSQMAGIYTETRFSSKMHLLKNMYMRNNYFKIKSDAAALLEQEVVMFPEESTSGLRGAVKMSHKLLFTLVEAGKWIDLCSMITFDKNMHQWEKEDLCIFLEIR